MERIQSQTAQELRSIQALSPRLFPNISPMPLTLPYLMNAHRVHPDTGKSCLEKLKADSKVRIDPSVLREVESAFNCVTTGNATAVLNLDRCGFPTELNPLTCLPGIETLKELLANGVYSDSRFLDSDTSGTSSNVSLLRFPVASPPQALYHVAGVLYTLRCLAAVGA